MLSVFKLSYSIPYILYHSNFSLTTVPSHRVKYMKLIKKIAFFKAILGLHQKSIPEYKNVKKNKSICTYNKTISSVLLWPSNFLVFTNVCIWRCVDNDRSKLRIFEYKVWRKICELILDVVTEYWRKFIFVYHGISGTNGYWTGNKFYQVLNDLVVMLHYSLKIKTKY